MKRLSLAVVFVMALLGGSIGPAGAAGGAGPADVGGPQPICQVSIEPGGEPSNAPSSLELPQSQQIPGFEECGSANLEVQMPGDPFQLATVTVTWGFVTRFEGDWAVGVWTTVSSRVPINPNQNMALIGYLTYKVTDVNSQQVGYVGANIGKRNFQLFGVHHSRDYAINLQDPHLYTLGIPPGHLVHLQLLGGDGSVTDITDPANPKIRSWKVAGRVIGEQVTPLT